MKKKIYLIDDNRSKEIPESLLSAIGRYEKLGIIEHIPHICEEREDDVERIYAINPATDVVFYHQSFCDSDIDHKFINSNEVLKGIIDILCENSIPNIVFSGSIYENRYFAPSEDEPESGEMTKRDMYARLENLLRQISESKPVDLRSFIENDMLSADEETPDSYKPAPDSKPISEITLPTIEINYIGNGDFSVGSDSDNVVNFDSVTGYGKLIEILKKYDEKEVHLISMPPLNTNPAPSAGAIRRMALAIRLSIHELKSRSLWPICFRSGSDAMKFITGFAKKANTDVLWVKGSYIEGINDGARIIPLTAEEYLNDFLKAVKVNPLSEVGNHTIANDWGAYIVARNIPDFNWEPLYKAALNKDPLYLTYLMCNRFRSVEEVNVVLERKKASKYSPLKIEKRNPAVKILLIDDQDDAWGGVIKGLFKEATVDVIGKTNGMLNSDSSKNFLTEEAYNKLMDTCEEYDAILLDLRLGGMKEEDIVNGDDCSGMKILKELTEINPALQVIMFTSSNKAWNLKKALSMATGYYIKESPALVLSEEETKENISNLIKTVDRAISYHNLVNCINIMQGIIKKPEEKSALYLVEDEVKEEIVQQLNIVSSMAVNKSHEDDTDWSYEFIALFQVLEIIKTESPNFDYRDRGNNNNDKNKKFKRLLLSVWNKDDEQEKNLDYLYDLRCNIVHKNKGENTASFDDFIALWDLVYDVLLNLDI